MVGNSGAWNTPELSNSKRIVNDTWGHPGIKVQHKYTAADTKLETYAKINEIAFDGDLRNDTDTNMRGLNNTFTVSGDFIFTKRMFRNVHQWNGDVNRTLPNASYALNKQLATYKVANSAEPGRL